MKRTRNLTIRDTSEHRLRAFIERVEQRVKRWQSEGLSAQAALNQAWANEILELESAGVLPTGYLRCRLDDAQENPTRSEQH